MECIKRNNDTDLIEDLKYLREYIKGENKIWLEPK
jgi:hypothetical protein